MDPALQPRCQWCRRVIGKQVIQRRRPVILAFFRYFQIGQPQPGDIDTARQGDVEQPQILCQPFFGGALPRLILFGQIPHHALIVRVITRDGIGAIGTDKRQQHQSVLQAFRFVDGDDLDTLPFGIQSQLLFVGITVRGFAPIQQPAQQRVFAIQRIRSRLQQFADMEHISQHAFALGLIQQPLRDLIPEQPLAQHRQNTALLPDPGRYAHALDGVFPQRFIIIELRQL